MKTQPKPPLEVFHCPACDNFFFAERGRRAERVCTICDQVISEELYSSPTPQPVAEKVPEPRAEQTVLPERRREVIPEASPVPVDPAGASRSSSSSSSRRSSKSNKSEPTTSSWGRWVALISLWFVVVGGVAAIIIYNSDTTAPESEEDIAARAEEARRAQYVMQEIGKCSVVFSSFLRETEASGRSQHVLDGTRLAPPMARYYRGAHEQISLEPSQVSHARSNLIQLSNGRYRIESEWQTHRGDLLEVVFEQVKGTWLMDWEQFVRAGSQTFSSFLGSTEPRDGDFRVWIRRRVTRDEGETSRIPISYIPCNPVSGEPPLDQHGVGDLVVGDPLHDRVIAQLERVEKEGAPDGVGSQMVIRRDDKEGYLRINARLRMRPPVRVGARPTVEIIDVYAFDWLGAVSQPE